MYPRHLFRPTHTTHTHTHDPQHLATLHRLYLTVKLTKPWTPEIFMEFYCFARNKPTRREITKLQTATVISLWFWGLLVYPKLYCDWPVYNQHSWNFSGFHGFLSLTVIIRLRKVKNIKKTIWRTGDEASIFAEVLTVFPESLSEQWNDNRAFSLTWPASMQIYGNKRKRLHKKRVQLPQDWFGTPTWPPFYCFGTPIWPPRRQVKTLYREFQNHIYIKLYHVIKFALFSGLTVVIISTLE